MVATNGNHLAPLCPMNDSTTFSRTNPNNASTRFGNRPVPLTFTARAAPANNKNVNPAASQIAKAANVTFRRVKYDGGAPAVIATVSGETDCTTQLASEEADMIRAKKLRPLFTFSNKPLDLEGFGTIPPLSDTLAGFNAPVNYFGIFIPKGVPDNVIAAAHKAWTTVIANSELLRKYSVSHGSLFAPIDGEAAQKAAFPAVQANAWMLFNNGQAKVSPATVGIPAP